MAHLTADMDQRSRNLFRQHFSDTSLRDEERRFDVQIIDSIIIVLAHVDHRLRPIGTGIVDEDLERRALGEEGFDGRDVRHV